MEKLAVILTEQQWHYLLDKLDPIAEVDPHLEEILGHFNESFVWESWMDQATRHNSSYNNAKDK